MTLTVGSLFSGIGGLDLGLEQAGMKTIWQVEFNDWARGKLDENFPHTEKFKDVREVGKHNLRPVDLICGGFPCQDLSALKFNRDGLAGEYFCRMDCYTAYFQRRNYGRVQNDIDSARHLRAKGGVDAEKEING